MGKSKDNIAEAEELQPILEKIYNILKNNIVIKSLWMFRHVPQIHSFKSWGFLAIDGKVKEAYEDQSLKEKVAKQIIPEDIGSIGTAYRQEKNGQAWLFEENTYGAPEGTVIELDLKLRHQSVLFVPFKDDNDIIAILLLSTSSTSTIGDIAQIQEIIKETFQKGFINNLVWLAFQNERYKDVIANVKNATMGSVNIDTSLEDFVQKHLINPIKAFNQGTSFVPIIEIEDKQHLQESQWGYSDVVYEKLRQALSLHIKNKVNQELSEYHPLRNFIDKCETAASFDVCLDEKCSITYMLKGGSVDVVEMIKDKAQNEFKIQADNLVADYEKESGVIKDPTTLLVIKKKYISEKLNQTFKDNSDSPFILVLKSNNCFGTKEDELIASNLHDRTLPLDTYREVLIDGNDLYKYLSKDYKSKLNGGLVFRVYTDEKYEDEDIFNEDVKAFIDQRCLYYKLLLDQKQAKKDAVRAAIAQVMARNMSHNFGSLVLSNLVGDTVYENLRDEIVEQKLDKFISLYNNDDVFKDKTTKNHQLQYFFQYLKSRMDYLSEVTFGIPNMLTTRMMYSNVMKELDQVRILMNHISGISDFKYSFILKHEDEELKSSNDLGIAFPSDILGCHAFYNIIENIIRNTAKHVKNNVQTVTFTITFKDVEGCEDIEEANELYCVEIDNGVYEEKIDDLVTNQNKRLNDSVLENNKLRSGSLGLLEMEASAAFLRQIDLPEIESDDYAIDYETPEGLSKYYHERNCKKRLNILKAFAIDEKGEIRENEKGEEVMVKTGKLGYRFFVQKAKEFLFVGNWQVETLNKKLLNYGIQVITCKRFMKDLKAGKVFSHQFLVYDDSLCKKEEDVDMKLKPYDSLLPLRRIHCEGEDAETKISPYFPTNDSEDLIQKMKEFVWERYFNERVMGATNNHRATIIINGSVDDKCTNCQLVFLDHANEDAFKKDINNIKNETGETWIENMMSKTYGKLPEYYKYYNQGRAKTSLKRYIDKIQFGGEIKKRVRQELFEAYHNNIIIIDERVQKFAEENEEGSVKNEGEKLIPCWKLFSSTNVHIPRRSKKDNNGNPIPLEDLYGNKLDVDDFRVFSLDPNDFGEIKKKVKTYVDYYAKGYSPKSKPFILVHYGILERMCGGDVKEINELLEQWVEMAKRVVVTSGRGAHSLDLPKSVCFVNLSSVLYVCNENRNKYLINYLLNQSRRKRNE